VYLAEYNGGRPPRFRGRYGDDRAARRSTATPSPGTRLGRHRRRAGTRRAGAALAFPHGPPCPSPASTLRPAGRILGPQHKPCTRRQGQRPGVTDLPGLVLDRGQGTWIVEDSASREPHASVPAALTVTSAVYDASQVGGSRVAIMAWSWAAWRGRWPRSWSRRRPGFVIRVGRRLVVGPGHDKAPVLPPPCPVPERCECTQSRLAGSPALMILTSSVRRRDMRPPRACYRLSRRDRLHCPS